MESAENLKKLVEQSKNIYILPSKDNEESIAGALSLFYTLKELNKNVNLLLEDAPERLKFLIPSLDYLSYPKNLCLSIPNSKTEISQIRYEKDEKDLKIYLTFDKGNVRKNDISFCFTEPKADLLITIGLSELNNNKGELWQKNILDGVDIVNIDNKETNTNFGKVNLIKIGCPLAELIMNFIKSINESLIKDDVATTLLSGLIIFSNNFHHSKTSPEILETAATLIKRGALHQRIVENLYS